MLYLYLFKTQELRRGEVNATTVEQRAGEAENPAHVLALNGPRSCQVNSLSSLRRFCRRYPGKGYVGTLVCVKLAHPPVASPTGWFVKRSLR